MKLLTSVPVLSSPEFDSALTQAELSTALISVFRGKFCDAILPNRKTTTFKKKEIIYDLGDKERTFFFLQNGFVKVGTITSDGHELIYDVRKGGDVVGELCASEPCRPDRAVALEETQAIVVPFQDVMEAVRKQPELLARLVDVFCRALNEAYAQVNTLAVDDTVHRLGKVLLKLAGTIGERSGPELPSPSTDNLVHQSRAPGAECQSARSPFGLLATPSPLLKIFQCYRSNRLPRIIKVIQRPLARP